MPVNPERGKLWLPPGTYEGEHLADPRSKFPRYNFPLTASRSLAAMSRSFAYFALSIPIRIKTFNDAYLHDLASTQDRHFKLFVLKTLKPIFRGLDVGHDAHLNHTIFSVEQRYWKETSDFFVSIGLLDRIKGHYYKYMEQEFVVPDPISDKPEAIRLTVTAVNSTRGQFVARRGPDGVLDAIKLPADPQFVTFGSAVIAGHPNPMSLIEDQSSYRTPDQPFQAPEHKRLDQLREADQRRVIQSIEEINHARKRGEFPQVRW